MRKFWKKGVITVLLGAILFSPLVPVSKIFAQPLNNEDYETLDYELSNPSYLDENPANAGNAGSSPTAKSQLKDIKPQGCSLLPLNFIACFAAAAYWVILWPISWFLFLAGKILDISMYFTLNMSKLLDKIPVVDIGWKIFRDLANIFFIFILLWIAIGIILGINSGKNKEILVHLIAVALLMNFSLFITKTVIDASNIVALHFYGLIINNTNPSAFLPDHSFSGAFMEGLQIQTLYNEAGSEAGYAAYATGAALNMGKIILMSIFGGALMLVAAYVFIVAAVLMLVRVIVLMFVMLLSPLAFLAFVLPGTAHHASKWRDLLFKQSFFAPAYMALSYVVVKTIQADAFKNGVLSINMAGASFADITGGTDGAVALVVNFLILIGLMLGCILIAHEMGAKGLDLAKATGAAAATWAASGRYITTAAGAVGYGAQFSGGILKRFPGLNRIPGVKQMGDKISGFGKRVNVGAEKLQRKVDVNELDKKFQKSAFGATAVGSWLREQTTGSKFFGTRAKFGGEKSVKEAYEEDEKRRQLREDIQNKEAVKQAVARVKIATEAEKAYKKPDRKDFTDKDGKFDERGFFAAEERYNQNMEGNLQPKRDDFETQDDFDIALKLYEERVLFVKPKRSDYGDDEIGARTFEVMEENYNNRFDAPKESDFIHPPKRESFKADTAGYAEFEKAKGLYFESSAYKESKKEFEIAQKMYGTGATRGQKAKKEELAAAKAAVGTAMNFLSPQGYAELDEHDISNLAEYANVRQLQAALESKEYTMGEKQKMLSPAFERYVKGFEKFGEEVNKYADLLDAYNKLIIDGEIELDGETGEAATIDPDGKYAKKKNGSWQLIPKAPVLSSELKNWARNDMTVPKYELMASIMPKAYQVIPLVQSIRHPVIFQQLRTSEKISYPIRNNNTYLKDNDFYERLVREDSGRYMPEDTPDVKKYAYSEAKKAASEAYSTATGTAEEKSRAARKAFKKAVANIARKDALRQLVLKKHFAGRSPQEIASTRGEGRNTDILLSGVDAGTYRLWSPKDIEDIVKGNSHMMKAFVKDLLGLEVMTEANKKVLKWLVEQTEGKKFPRPELDAVEIKTGNKIMKDGKEVDEVKTFSLSAVLKELDDKGRVEFESDRLAEGLKPGEQRPDSQNRPPVNPDDDDED